LQVAAGGATFALDTDLDFLFTGFSGSSAWISPGHLEYHVERVRLELRQPRVSAACTSDSSNHGNKRTTRHDTP
jgi:hypothetical protein